MVDIGKLGSRGCQTCHPNLVTGGPHAVAGRRLLFEMVGLWLLDQVWTLTMTE